MDLFFSDIKHRIHGGAAAAAASAAAAGKFQTHHYVAPEFRRQGSLQRKAGNINFEDLRVHSPVSPDIEQLYRPDSRTSLSHSTPRPSSRTAVYYPKDTLGNRTIDSAIEHSGEWDSASYV